MSAPPRAQLVAEVGQWLDGLAPWSWWVTLTFKSEVSEASGLRALKKWFRVVAKKLVRAHVVIAWGYGKQSRGVMHFHCLLSPYQGANRFNASLADLAWKRSHYAAGHTRIERFIPEGGAAKYLADHEAWDANVACPRPPGCRRAHGCVKAPGAW